MLLAIYVENIEDSVLLMNNHIAMDDAARIIHWPANPWISKEESKANIFTSMSEKNLDLNS